MFPVFTAQTQIMVSNLVQAATGDPAIDTLAIQTALDAGGAVWLTAGEYIINETLLIDDNTHLKWNGATLKLADGVQKQVIRNRNPDSGNVNITMEGPGTVDGNRAGNPPLTPFNHALHGAAIYNVKRFQALNLTFKNCIVDGLYFGIRGQVNGITVGGDNENATVLFCHFEGNGRAGCSITRGRYVHVMHNQFADNNRLMLDLPLASNPGNSASLVLEPNDPLDQPGFIWMGYNRIDAPNCRGLQIAGSTGIHNIWVLNNGINATNHQGIDITATAHRAITIEGNGIEIQNHSGIAAAYGGAGGMIRGNQISGNMTANKYGILVHNGAFDWSVLDNTVRDCSPGIASIGQVANVNKRIFFNGNRSYYSAALGEAYKYLNNEALTIGMNV